MHYLLDTNILLHIMRNSELWMKTEERFNFFGDNNKVFISIVSEAEIYSLAGQLNWGKDRIIKLGQILDNFKALYINKDVVRQYVEIDVFSQGRHQIFKLPKNMTARNMGKNDLWIAATAVLANAELITTDQDFNHLDGTFLKVHCIV